MLYDQEPILANFCFSLWDILSVFLLLSVAILKYIYFFISYKLSSLTWKNRKTKFGRIDTRIQSYKRTVVLNKAKLVLNSTTVRYFNLD